jgi:hypothetical protein
MPAHNMQVQRTTEGVIFFTAVTKPPLPAAAEP